MNKRDLQNAALLKKIAKDFGFEIAFWSLADTIARRSPFQWLYHKTHSIRYKKCKEYLIQNYRNVLNEQKKKYESYKKEDIPKLKGDYKIWMFWWQGLEVAPQIIKECVLSIKRYSKGHELVIISKDNIEKYISLPDYIFSAFQRRIIPIAQFSDVVRLMILTQYGGIWMDATLLVTENFCAYAENYSFYTVKHNMDVKWHICNGKWATFHLASGANNPVLSFCKDMLLEYWKKEKCLLCYLIFDCILSIGYESIPVIKEEIDLVPINNKGVFALLDKRRFNIVSDDEVKNILSEAYIYKLTYKQSYKENIGGERTLYGAIKKIALD